MRKLIKKSNDSHFTHGTKTIIGLKNAISRKENKENDPEK